MLHLHELTKAVQADRERAIRRHAPVAAGISSHSRHPETPDSGVVEPGLHRIVLRREPRASFGM